MSGSYPLAYRRTAPDPWRRGFQQSPRGPIVPPVPANDPFWPANDNPPKRLKRLSRTVKRVPFGRKGFGYAFKVVRNHPLYRLWEYADLILSYHPDPDVIGAASAYGGSEWKLRSYCPGIGGPTHQVSGQGLPATPVGGVRCLAGQYQPSAEALGSPIPRYQYYFSTWQHYTDYGVPPNDVPVYKHVKSYYRDKLPRSGAPPEPGLTLVDAPWQFPDVAPSLEVTVNPQAVPLIYPAPDPAPVPFRMIPYQFPNPWYSPFERTVRGPAVVAGPKLSNPIRLTFQPGQNPRVESNPPPHVRKPPPKGTKERKVAIAVGGIPAKIIGAVTETADVISAIFKALPGNIKAKYGRKPQDKARAIYDHYDKVDIPRALANLLAQQVSDRAWGHIGKRSGEAARRAGKSTGFQLGPWDTAFSDFGNMMP